MGIFSSKLKTYVGTSISKMSDYADYIKSSKIGIIQGTQKNASLTEYIMENVINGMAFKGRNVFRYGESQYTFGLPNDTLFVKSGTTSAISTAVNTVATDLGYSNVLYSYGFTTNYFHKAFGVIQTAYDLDFATNKIRTIPPVEGNYAYLHEAAIVVGGFDATAEVEDFNNPYPAYSVFTLKNKIGTGIDVVATIRQVIVSTAVTAHSSTYDTTLVSSTETIEDLGETDFSTSDTSYGSSSPFDRTVTSTVPASLPLFYQDTGVSSFIEGTVRTNGLTITTYVAATTTKTVDVYSYVEETGTNTTTTTTYTQSTSTVATDIQASEPELISETVQAGFQNTGFDPVFFTYVKGTGTYPTIDSMYDVPYTTPGDYMPRIYYRWEFQKGDIDPSSVEYKNSKTISKKLGVDYDYMVEAVHKLDNERTQADLDLVRSVYTAFIVSADSQVQIEQRYLFEYFKKMHTTIGGTTRTDDYTTFHTTISKADLGEVAIVINDDRSTITLGFQGIFKRVVNGVIGEVDTFTSLKGTVNVITSISADEWAYSTTDTYPWHIYRKQINTTQYEEYEVVGLNTKYLVAEGYYSNSGYTEGVDDPKDILYVPIDQTLVRELQLFEQEELLYGAIHVVSNSFQVVKVKWYQRNGWANAFKVAAIVAAAYGIYTGDLLLALSAATTLQAVLTIVLNALLEYLVNLAYVYVFIEVVGEELAFLAAIALAIYSFNGGSASFGKYNFTAKELMSVGQSVLKGVGDSFNRKIEALKSDYDSFIEGMEVKLDELKELEDELYKPNVQLANIIIGETPSDFYNRTIHKGNIGVLPLSIPENYVALSLRLPTINDTLGV